MQFLKFNLQAPASFVYNTTPEFLSTEYLAPPLPAVRTALTAALSLLF